MIALHIILAAAACVALWWLWRGVTRTDGRAALIISAGFLIRALAGQALFWISWLGLPFARSLQLGEGFWFFAMDSPGYMDYANKLAHGHPAATYPSRVFVHVLALFVDAFGRFASVAVLLNCATYLAACGVILFIGRNAKTPTLVALAAVAFTPGTVLWSCQPLKDSLFLFVFIAMIGACYLWQEALTARQRVAAAAAMVLFIYTLAGMRWYFAIFLCGCWLVFAVLVVFAAPRKRWLLLGGGLLLALFLIAIQFGAEYDIPRLTRATPGAQLEHTRRGFATVPGATTITPGRALAPPPKPTPAAASPVQPPVAKPTRKPAVPPPVQPVAIPTATPAAPSPAQPVAVPTPQPAAPPPVQPVAVPTPPPAAPLPVQPVPIPTPQPAAPPTVQPAPTPTPKPAAPTPVQPVAAPTPKPAATPPVQPVATPTPKPTAPPRKSAIEPVKPAATPPPKPAPAPPKPAPKPSPQPSPPPRPTRRVIATAAVTFLPRILVELLGIAHVGAGRGQWIFVEADTLAFDAVLIFAIVYSIRSRRRLTPLSILLLLLFLVTTVPIVYVVNNFGTLFRLRQMLYLIVVLLPLTSAPRRR